MNFLLEIPIELNKFIENSKAELIVPLKEKRYFIRKVITDTRKYKEEGGIFFAFKGKNFNGHNFINEIIDKIDFVVISDKEYVIERYKDKFIIVKDTVLAFDELASIYRDTFKNLKIICVVGSNGKTTTKELIKKIFSKKYNTLATESNNNNLVGVAYTLFSLNSKIEYCILELGISMPSEMETLGRMSKPSFVIFTNIGKEHLEFLENLERVFLEETKILSYMDPLGLTILNYDDIFLRQIKKDINKKFYSLENKNADIYLEYFKFFEDSTELLVIIKDRLEVKLKLPLKVQLVGRHNIYNMLAALGCGFFCGVIELDLIKDSLENFLPLNMRGERFILNGNILVNESYNANPDSMRVSIKEFAEIYKKRKKILVLGDMLELGKYSEQEHRNLSKIINLKEIYRIFLIGKEIEFLYKEINYDNKVRFYKNKEQLYEKLLEIINKEQNLAIFFKASHNVGLWEVVEKLKNLKKE